MRTKAARVILWWRRFTVRWGYSAGRSSRAAARTAFATAGSLIVVAVLVLGVSSAFSDVGSPAPALLDRPDPQMDSALAAARADLERIKAQRETSAARAERRARRTRFQDLSSSDALAADRTPSAGVLGAPAVSLVDAAQVRSYSPDGYSAVVADDAVPGGSAVVESTLPLRAPGIDGTARPVNLELTETGDAHAPRNPLVPTEIGARLYDGVTLGDTTKVRLHVSGRNNAGGSKVGNTVFYANVAPDTDLDRMGRRRCRPRLV